MRRLLGVTCTAELIGAFCTAGVRHVNVSSPLPEGAQFVRAYVDEVRGWFICIFEHAQFNVVPEGSPIPITKLGAEISTEEVPQ